MTQPDEDKALRRAAEAQLRATKRAAPAAADVPRLMHELQVHQIELEMQNSELRDVRAELETALALYTNLYDFAPVGYFTLDRDGVIHQINLAAARLLGKPRASLVGQPFKRFVAPNDLPVLARLLERVLAHSERESCDVKLVGNASTAGDRFIHLETEAKFIGGFVQVAALDVTERKEAEATIHRLAYYDTLTKLPNRLLLQDRLKQVIAAAGRTHEYGAIFFIDLDNFKALNDTHGHDVGDLLLVEVGQRLRSVIRGGDTLGRLGGDEFVVLMENLSKDRNEAAVKASQLGEKLLAAMEQRFQLGSIEYHSKLSIGVSLFNKDDNGKELLKQADLALYQSKKAGRNTLSFFDPTMQAALQLRTALESELHQAISHKQLRLFYQAQVDAALHVIGVEVLLRWQHPTRGLVPPDAFVPLAEDSGLILPIGLWTLETACAQIKSWENEACTCDLQVALKVSARQFRHPDCVAKVQSILESSGINPARLKLELTERLLLEDIEGTIVKMNAIKRMGVKFSMDDFGTGYLSLSNLAQLPLDQLKIDKSFVCKLPGEKRDETIARAIITIGRGLNMDVIAEGVETEAQRAFLEAHGCCAYQGYLFSRPLPKDEFEAFVRQG